MPSTVPAPILDLRTEEQTVAQAIGALPSELSDRSASNPAVVLLEAAGYILGRLQYQLNRWPAAVITSTVQRPVGSGGKLVLRENVR